MLSESFSVSLRQKEIQLHQWFRLWSLISSVGSELLSTIPHLRLRVWSARKCPNASSLYLSPCRRLLWVPLDASDLITNTPTNDLFLVKHETFPPVWILPLNETEWYKAIGLLLLFLMEATAESQRFKNPANPIARNPVTAAQTIQFVLLTWP